MTRKYNRSKSVQKKKSKLDLPSVKQIFKHPEKLRDMNEIWNKEWDKLLEGVNVEDE
jgi:hypothetical protein